MPAVSIIIPYYNTDLKLFNNCIKSLLNQTFPDFEILIINDGSDHKFDSDVYALVKLDDRIRYFYQENKGVSAARNMGVELAEGEFIAFVDSDDFVSAAFLEEAHNTAMEYNADFVIGGVSIVKDEIFIPDINTNIKLDHNCIKIFKDDEIKGISRYFISSQSIRFKNAYFSRGPVSRLIKRSIAKKIKFPEGMPIGEDLIWNQCVFKNCKCVAMIQRAWYFYYQNNNSVMHSYNPNNIQIVETHLNELYELLLPCENEIYYEFVNHIIEMIHGCVCNCYLTNKKCEIGYRERIHIFNGLRKKKPWNLINKKYLKYASLKQKMIYFAYKMGFLIIIVHLFG